MNHIQNKIVFGIYGKGLFLSEGPGRRAFQKKKMLKLRQVLTDSNIEAHSDPVTLGT